MTDKEKAVVMAYTGVVMLKGEKFQVFHKYVEDLLGRPVFTHELADEKISAEIKEKSKADFLKLCRETTEESTDCVDKLDAVIYEAGDKWNRKDIINNFDFSLRPFQKLAQKYDCYSFVVDIDPGCIADGYIEITVYNDYIE